MTADGSADLAQLTCCLARAAEVGHEDGKENSAANVETLGAENASKVAQAADYATGEALEVPRTHRGRFWLGLVLAAVVVATVIGLIFAYRTLLVEVVSQVPSWVIATAVAILAMALILSGATWFVVRRRKSSQAAQVKVD
eukprot:CAMPEP_0170620574 /NCGR_PEP_ID=MMETSP0224-20130122/28131_1 /TAXON_ID=285029 /ORGANISM="Togula jolla, Strain CCCM 725" /LENGTH=140 /DNA_ID=CAMNT_0010946757 /DNA_START=76 /DNA_END=497 /DNA_ORIENTATION=-